MFAPLLFALVWPAWLTAQSPAYPVTPREAVVDDYHGTAVADPYRWLETLDDPRTAEWVQAQTQLTSGYLATIPRRDAIHARLTELVNYARTDVPWREAGRLYYLEDSGTQPQAALYTLRHTGDAPALLFDPNAISPDGSIAFHDYAIAPDGRLLAYRTAKGGADVAEIHVRDLSTGKDLDDVMRGSAVCWTADARGFFYALGRLRTPEDVQNGSRVVRQAFYHTLGEPQSQDRLLLEWQENVRWPYVMASDDYRYILLVAEEGTVSELHVIDLGDPARPNLSAPPVKLLADQSAFHTPVDFVGHTLFVRTNFEAPRGRVLAIDLRDGARRSARALIPEARDPIESAAVVGDRIVLHYLVDVKSRLLLFAFDGAPKGEIELPGVGAVGWPLSGRPSTPELFYSFATFLAPNTVYRYDFKSGKSEPFRPSRVPFDASRYETKQVFYTSKDGTRVPMFVTAAKNLERDGTHPTMLTAYGGYGSTLEPEYQPDIPLWLEMGGIYAVANIRGGGEYGEDWHRAGMLEHKQNSFDDFYAAAEYLIAERYTATEKLAIYGHSNGGLLIGAAITQRPDLFRAAVANAGHYDMLRYHTFTAGAAWTNEYGSPDDPAAFAYLHAYSPLHNVKSGTCYPSTLLLAADHDDRVVPSHAYKFVSELQAAQACDRPILLRVAIDASHSYASRQAYIDERSDMWAFVAARLGVGANDARD